MARVSKTSPFHARRPTETRANNEGQEQREDIQPQSNPEDDKIIHISSEEEWTEKNKKRKGKLPMKKTAKRLTGKTRSIKEIVTGVRSKASETATSPKRGRERGRKTTFAVRSASYDASEQEEKVTIGDQERKGKEMLEETNEVEDDEACKRITKERNLPMKKTAKRGSGKTRSINEIITGVRCGSGRKTTFAVRSASYDASEQEEKVTIGDLKRKGKEMMEETNEVEDDEACKRITKERNLDDDGDQDDDDFMSYCNTLEDINVL